MTNEEISLNTKKALAATLKELMCHKPFRKITVSELIRECNVNRKTFYYHFEDIYALLRWTFEQEIIDVAKKLDYHLGYVEVISFVYDYVYANSFIINCAYDSLGRDVLKQFFQKDFHEITNSIIAVEEERCSIHLDEKFRGFLCSLFTEAIAGMLIDFFRNPEQYTKEELIEYFTIVVEHSVKEILQARCSTSMSRTHTSP